MPHRKVGLLGRKPGVSEIGSRFKLADYLVDPLPIWRGNDDFTVGLPADLGMCGNATYGDCGPAGDYHLGFANAHTAGEPLPPVPDDGSQAEQEVVDEYLSYDNGQDEGVDLGQWLTYRLTHSLAGLPPIGGFAQVSVSGNEYASAMHIFGGLYTGILVNEEMEEEFGNGEPWTSTNSDWIGGHAVPHLGRNTKWGRCVTWGQVQLFSWANWRAVREEAYVVLTAEIMNTPGGIYHGLHVAQLKTDLELLHGTFAA